MHVHGVRVETETEDYCGVSCHLLLSYGLKSGHHAYRVSTISHWAILPGPFTFPFYMGSGNPTQIFMLTTQAPYRPVWSSFPSVCEATPRTGFHMLMGAAGSHLSQENKSPVCPTCSLPTLHLQYCKTGNNLCSTTSPSLCRVK